VPGKRILIVEDEQIVSRDLQNLLRRIGHIPVGPAANGADAIRLAAETRPDLILMDVKLNGGVDGMAAALEIAKTQTVPIIYVTAYSQAFLTQPSSMVAPFLCIAKPFSAAAIESAIQSILGLPA
jgi:CheY-like chemotaxis protein